MQLSGEKKRDEIFDWNFTERRKFKYLELEEKYTKGERCGLWKIITSDDFNKSEQFKINCSKNKPKTEKRYKKDGNLTELQLVEKYEQKSTSLKRNSATENLRQTRACRTSFDDPRDHK